MVTQVSPKGWELSVFLEMLKTSSDTKQVGHGKAVQHGQDK